MLITNFASCFFIKCEIRGGMDFITLVLGAWVLEHTYLEISCFNK